MNDPSFQPRPDTDAAEGLAADLDGLFGRLPAVTRAVDDAILTAARRRSSRVRQVRALVRWGGGAAAAAAILLVALRLVPTDSSNFNSNLNPKFNPNSPVTILDAFSLARQLRGHGKVDPSWDVNGDGGVDQSDVDALAARAVRLPRGGVQ